MAYTPKEWQKEGGPNYKPNDYLYAEDINKMIHLFNQFIVFENNDFAGIKIPQSGLSLFSNGTEWLLTVNEEGILQTEEVIKE